MPCVRIGPDFHARFAPEFLMERRLMVGYAHRPLALAYKYGAGHTSRLQKLVGHRLTEYRCRLLVGDTPLFN